MSLIQAFQAITTDEFLEKIVEKKLSPEVIFDKFKTTKTTYRAAILDILNKNNDINKLKVDDFKILIESLRKLTDTIHQNGSFSLNTKAMLYGEIRKMVEPDRRILLKNVLTLTTSERKLRADTQATNVKNNNKTQTNITEQTIKKMVKYLIAIEDKTLAQKIILAQLSIGTRLIEILNKNVSKFRIDTNNNILQSGVAKSTSVEKISKPTIFITPTIFIKLIKEIRKKIGVESSKGNVYLTNRYNEMVNNEIRRIFLKFGIPKKLSSSHGLRKIYVNYAYKKFAPQGMSLTCWISEKLGHSEKFLSTAAHHYSTVNIETKDETPEETKDETKDEPKDEIKSIKGVKMTLHEKYEFIEKLINRGYSSYSEFQTKGVTTYMLSKYKKSKNITGEIR